MASLRMLYMMTMTIVHHDLDLHCQGHEFLNLNISKTVKASKKSLRTTVIEDDVCH